MRQSLELRLGQRLTMTPQLQQAIKLLQLSAIDLQTEIQQALEENPLLEEGDDGMDDHVSSQTDSENNGTDADSELDLNSELGNGEPLDDTFEGQWETEYEPLYTNTVRNSTDDTTAFEIDARSAPETTLRDHLHWQMCMTPFSARDRGIATAIIDAVNEDGYLTASLQEIKDSLGPGNDIEPDEIEAVLHQVQNFDPLGVGARNVKECLLIQLRQFHPDTQLLDQARLLVEEHLDLLGSKDFAKLQRVMKLDADTLREVVRFVQGLHPRPGSTIAPLQPSYVVPDVIAHKIRGVWRAELNPDTVARLRINDTYRAMLRRGDTTDANRYIQDQLQEARWFIKSLRNRNDTLLKVANAIIERQQEFFDRGEQAMRPMVLHDIADTLNMHESTISRATTQKYMLTPRGIFELKYFFSSSVGTTDGGTCSSTVIRSWIKKFIETEPPAKPISDSQITRLLAEQGITVARRTVAKYREGMNIPPSNQRKSL